MGDRLALVLAALALVLLGGVVYTGMASPERPVKEEYSLSIEAEASGEEVRARGRTNLPDGARLYVYADRLYRLQDSDIWNAARIGESEAVVSGGRWEATVPASDEAWVRAVSRRVDENRFSPVRAIQSKVRVTALFAPLVAQPEPIQEKMGPNFEGLSGSDQAIRQAEQWVLRSFVTVEIPLRRELEAQLMAVGR